MKLSVRIPCFKERATSASHSGKPTVHARDHANKRSQFLAGPIARGATLSLTIRLSALGLGFAQAVLFARLLGPAGYGTVAVALSVAALVANLALLGLGGLAVREVSRLRIREQFSALKGFVVWSAAIVIAVAVIGGGVIVGLTTAPDLALPPEFAWGAAIVPLMAIPLLLRGLSQGFGRVLDAQAPTELVRPAAMIIALSVALVFALPITANGAEMALRRPKPFVHQFDRLWDHRNLAVNSPWLGTKARPYGGLR